MLANAKTKGGPHATTVSNDQDPGIGEDLQRRTFYHSATSTGPVSVAEKANAPAPGPSLADDLTPLALSTKQDSLVGIEHTNSDKHEYASEKAWLKAPFQSVDIKFAVSAS